MKKFDSGVGTRFSNIEMGQMRLIPEHAETIPLNVHVLSESQIMNIKKQLYVQQLPTWPSIGRHILAQYDESSILVYQAFRPSIAEFAVANQTFGGEFSYSRMSWIKPNFLWMMYRSRWAQKEGQERVLAIRLNRTFFENILRVAVPSTVDSVRYSRPEDWKAALATSDVRLQWDPDHDPHGNPFPRRAIQLGLRGDLLARFGKEEIVSIEDLTPFVCEQREILARDPSQLVTPVEPVYIPMDPEAREAIGLDRSIT